MMIMSLFWHAIENRVPSMQVSNNGETVLLNAIGQLTNEPIDLFTQGILTETVTLQQHFSIYRDYQTGVHLAFALLFMVLVFLGHRQGHIFSDASDSLPTHRDK